MAIISAVLSVLGVSDGEVGRVVEVGFGTELELE